MKNIVRYILVSIISLVGAQAIADNTNSYHNPYGKDYGLAHSYGYFIQKKAASTPSGPSKVRSFSSNARTGYSNSADDDSTADRSGHNPRR